MRRLLIVLVPLALMAAGGAAWWWFARDGFTPPPPWTDDMQVIADGNNRFAFDLYAQLRQQESGNLFFSPYSAHTALAMTATGARGKTRDEMLKVLHLPDDDRMLASGDLGKFYAHPRKDFELSVANALWGQKGFPWRREWLDMQNARFSAGFLEADFRANPEAERQRINRWVEEKTRDRIKELLKEGTISPLTAMVLANAVFFKGQWEKQFDRKMTRDTDFTLVDGAKIKVPLMYRKGGYRHYVERSKSGDFRAKPEFQVAEVPYKGSELSMVVVLPGSHDGLPAIEAKVTAEALTGWLAQAGEAKEGLYLPKFQFQLSLTLNGQLKSLGMVEAFKPYADFSGMYSSSKGLFVSAVVHEAFVDVNEEGTEAAAATAVVMGKVVSDRVVYEFRADHPFLFLIRDVRHGTILFMGRVENPK
jgi:serpin B